MHILATTYQRLQQDTEAVKKHEAVRISSIPCCDLCIYPKSARYDCKTKGGSWGYLCEEHFKSDGIGLGLGKGQRLIAV